MSNVKISLAQLLKHKARLAGELKEATTLFTSYNSQVEGPDARPVAQYWERVDKLSARLIKVKLLIAKANVPVLDKLVNLPELKGTLVTMQGLNVFEGEKEDRYSLRSEAVTRKYVAFIGHEHQTKNVKDLKDLINATQDQLDAFNAMTFIEVPEDLMSLD